MTTADMDDISYNRYDFTTDFKMFPTIIHCMFLTYDTFL